MQKRMIECTQGPEALIVRILGTMNRAELDQVGEKLGGIGDCQSKQRVVFDVTEASTACLRYVPSFVSVMRKAKDAEVRIVVGSKVQRDAVDGVLSAFPGSCVVELAPKSKKNGSTTGRACQSQGDREPNRATCAARGS